MKFIKLLQEAQFHGARRLLERRYRYRDRAIWCIILGVLLWWAISVLTQAISRYLANPTYNSRFVRYQHHIKLPMVTICPEIKFSKHNVERFIEMSLIPPGTNVTYFKAILHQLSAFYAPDERYRLEDLELIESFLNYNQVDVELAGYVLSTSCEETLLGCSLQGKVMDCDKLFRFEITRYGFCCVFNGKSLRREASQPLPTRAYTTKGVGPLNGLTLILNQSQKMDNPDLTYKWLVVQDEQFFSDILFNGTALSRGWETWAIYTHVGMVLSEETRTLSPNLRKCRLYSEPLKYFPIYKRKHCLLECEMEQVIARCGCLGVTYPPLPLVPVCKAREINCVKAASIPPDANLCECPQACEEDYGYITYYNFRLSNHSNYNVIDEIYKGVDYNKISVVRVFAAQRSKIIFDRKSVYGLYDLYSQLGGIFSVFFGCSLLTLLEFMQLFWYGILSIWKKCYEYSQGSKVKKTKSHKIVFTPVQHLPKKKKYQKKILNKAINNM